jgi:hypothetical protein
VQRVQRRKGTCDVLPFKVTVFVGRTNLISIHSPFIHKDKTSQRIPLLAIVALVSHRAVFACGTSNFGDEPIPMEIYDLQPKIREPLGRSNWMVLEQLDSRVEWVFFSFFFLNACTCMKAVWDEGILGRKNALNGHVQRT